MLHFLLLQNRQGRTRLSKYYTPYTTLEKQQLEHEIYRLIIARDTKMCNFIEYRTYKIIYRRYAGLYFIYIIDTHDNELSYLESIHLFVEVLDRYFQSVCELDLVFNFHKIYAILDEIYLAGEIQETSKKIILDRMEAISKIE